jgi:RNA recognition motif-containing protein
VLIAKPTISDTYSNQTKINYIPYKRWNICFGLKPNPLYPYFIVKIGLYLNKNFLIWIFFWEIFPLSTRKTMFSKFLMAWVKWLKVRITISNITKQNKGFCFVTMPVDEAATKAIEALNGKEVDGKKLEVVKVEGSVAEWEKKILRHGGGKAGGSSNNFSQGGKIKAGGGPPKSFGGGQRGVIKTGGSRGS